MTDVEMGDGLRRAEIAKLARGRRQEMRQPAKRVKSFEKIG